MSVNEEKISFEEMIVKEVNQGEDFRRYTNGFAHIAASCNGCYSGLCELRGDNKDFFGGIGSSDICIAEDKAILDLLDRLFLIMDEILFGNPCEFDFRAILTITTPRTGVIFSLKPAKLAG